MDELTPSLIVLLEAFRPCFRQEVFATFQKMVAAWCVCLGKKTISRVWETTGKSQSQSHCSAFRLFSEAAWNWDELCRIMLLMLLESFVPGFQVWIAVDDTLCHKRGAKVAFGGIFLDAVLSSKKHKNFRFGNNWVTLALVVKLPFRSDRYFAQPILWRVYQKKDKKDKGRFQSHQTKVEMAAKMIALVAGWIPSHAITLVADDAYMGQKLLKTLPSNVEVIGPLRWNAKLFEQPGEDDHRNCKKGKRMPTPQTILANDEKYPVQTVTIEFLGQSKVLEVKRLTDVLWYDVCHTSPVQVVLVRDPEGHWRNEALACTNLTYDIATIITGYCRRWAIELCYRDAKQYLGFHDPQVYCEKSVERAAPMAWFLSSLLMLWYWRHGQESPAAERHRPWYRCKTSPTFADMLATLRLSLWNHWLQPEAGETEEAGDAEGSAGSADEAEQRAKLAWLIEYLSTAA